MRRNLFFRHYLMRSPRSELNVDSSFLLFNDISTEVSNVDEILLPVIYEAIQKTSKGIYSVEDILTPNTTQVNLILHLLFARRRLTLWSAEGEFLLLTFMFWLISISKSIHYICTLIHILTNFSKMNFKRTYF